MRLKFITAVLAFCAVFVLLLSLTPANQPIATQVVNQHTPDSSIRYAMGDMATIPADVQPYIRYLSLYNIPKIKRREVAQTVSFVINSLSKRKKMYIPVFVGASDETVIRLNLRDYDIDPKVWDELGRTGSGPKAFPEPYFHAAAVKIEAGVRETTVKKTRQVKTGYLIRNSYGQLEPQYRTEEYDEVIRVENPSKNTLVTAAPWLDSTTISLLCKASQSEYPILRADWFIIYSTLDPIYHKFLDFGETEEAFDLAIFADTKLAEKARSQIKSVVVKSGVARNNRTILRSFTFTGGYKWETRDALKSTDDRNYVQNFLHEKFDAKEIIATLPNGLQGYFVTDGKGKRQDKADNEVATDYMAADKIVRTARSCIYCHSSGILSITDEIRTLNKKLTNREQIMLLVTKEEDAYRIEDLFGTPLDPQIVRDQQIYADAIGQATGLTPQKNSQQFFGIWEGYMENLMTREQISLDCGITLQELDRYARLSNDPLFLGLVMDPIRPVRRDHFEQAYQSFMVMMIRARANEQPAPTPVIIMPPEKLNSKK